MSDLELPLTRYAAGGDVNVAYQVMGDGPIDLIMIPGIVSHIEFLHEMPGYTAFLHRFSKFARVVTFDKRGQGLSDRISGAPTLEQRGDCSPSFKTTDDECDFDSGSAAERGRESASQVELRS